MPPLRVGLSDRHAECKAIVQLGVREVKVAGTVQTLHEGLVGGVSCFEPETDQIEGRGSGQFEAAVIADPSCEFLRERDVLPYVMLQSFHAVVAQHKP